MLAVNELPDAWPPRRGDRTNTGAWVLRFVVLMFGITVAAGLLFLALNTSGN